MPAKAGICFTEARGFSPVNKAHRNQLCRLESSTITPTSGLLGLGVDRLDFQPTAPRERIVSEDMKCKQMVLEEEQARLAASH